MSQLSLTAECALQLGLINTVRGLVTRGNNGLAKAILGLETRFCLPDRRDISVALRKGSKDWRNFVSTFVQKQYDVSTFPQWRGVLDAYESSLRAGRVPVIIDCGANIGLTSIWFALLFPRAKVIALELDRDNFEQLVKNAKPFEAIIPLNTAIWGEKVALTYKKDSVSTDAFSAEPAEATSDACVISDATTVDELITQFEIEDLLCVKIDIEGGEVSVLQSAGTWIGHTKLLFVEIHDWLYPGLGAGQTLVKAIADEVYDLILCGEVVAVIFSSPDPIHTN